MNLHGQLGIAYAGLGRKDEAIREGKRAVALLPVSEDALWGPRGRRRIWHPSTLLLVKRMLRLTRSHTCYPSRIT